MTAQLFLWLFLQGIPAVPPDAPNELAKLVAIMKPGTWAELKTDGYNAELLKVQNHHTMYFAHRPAKVYLYKHATSPLAKTTDPLDQAKPMAPEARRTTKLVFSVRSWEGEYASKDIPGGVASTPVVGAIYTISFDGGQPKKVVALGKNTDYPAFHPDGKWLYFQSNSTGHTHVYRCRPDGSGITNLTAGNRLGKQWTDAYGHALSRDGAKMVYTVHDGSSGRVVIANADGSESRLVAPELGYIYMASLSPTNDRIICSGPARGYRLLLVRLEDGKVTNLTPDHPESFVPQFTPDGNTIVFLRRDGDIYRVNADGSNLRRLTNGNRYVEFKLSAKDQHGSTDGPHVSPDGRRVAYIAINDGVANVCVMNIDGSNQRQITFRKTPCGRVRWSPDGKRLAFVSFEGKYPQLFTVPVEGGELQQLTRVDGAVYFVNWAPAQP